MEPKDNETSAADEETPEHVHGRGCSHTQQPIRREVPKIGRNDPCHCGSGKKFKKCHGA